MLRSKKIVLALFAAFAIAGLAGIFSSRRTGSVAHAQTTPTPAAAAFDQTAALVKLREQIKGRENEPASAVFKNIQTMKATTAGRLLSVMEMGFARSLGVNCTHCHVPEKWELEDKPQKQIARDMSAMVRRINTEILKGIPNLKSESPIVNCTTCHRGEVKPALNIAPR